MGGRALQCGEKQCRVVQFGAVKCRSAVQYGAMHDNGCQQETRDACVIKTKPRHGFVKTHKKQHLKYTAMSLLQPQSDKRRMIEFTMPFSQCAAGSYQVGLESYCSLNAG